MISRRSAYSIHSQAAGERGKLKKRSAGIERLLQAFAALQEALPFEQQLAYVLEAAREEVGLDRLVVWVAAPEGDRLLHVAGSGLSEEDRLSLGERMEIPLAMAGAMGKVCRAKMPLVVDKAHPLSPKLRLKQPYSNIKALRTKSFVIVPIIDDGRALGLLVGDNKYRRTPLPVHKFHLLPVFALHPVKKVDEAQLVTEREAHKRELTESLEQQRATSEILRVISQSQRDVQPVFEAIAANARKLCEGTRAAVYTYDGELIEYAAGDTVSTRVLEAIQQTFPILPGRGGATARAILTQAVAYVPDVNEEPEYELQKLAQSIGFRSALAVPMLREGSPIGAITVTGAEPAMFTDRQIAMLQTFADQAVIAIENTRLFNEVQTRNRELTESLERQSATAEILKLIPGSSTDLQPVFDAIVRAAVRLCDGRLSTVLRLDGESLDLAAHVYLSAEGLEAYRRAYPRRVDRGTVAGCAILDRAVINLVDAQDEATVPPQSRAMAAAAGFRGVLVVPMLREGKPIGIINVARAEPGPFSQAHVDLLKIFGDQAVIAIENTGLFNELQARTAELGRSVEQLRSLAEVSQAVNSTLDLERVLTTIVTRAVQLSSTDGGAVYEYDESSGEFRPRATYGFPQELVDLLLAKPLRMGEGATGRAAAEGAPIQIPDVRAQGAYTGPLQQATVRAGSRALLAVPLLREARVLGSLVVSRNSVGAFPPEVVDMLQTFAAQSTLAIQNARLFREIEEKSRELQIASQHKSQFLANMSHELRTPLNAILGYTELIVDQVYGEVPDKIGKVIERVQHSGRHLLGLINDVLDLSKIEAGQLVLTLNDYSFKDIVQAVASAVESLAIEKQLRLNVNVAADLPVGHGDDRRITQVLLNLVGNAIKFTEKGEVEVRVSASDGAFLVAVTDTGPGIKKEDQERIFEEFQQSDSSLTKQKSGTGLGLAIAKRIVELHGGHMWVESTLGKGSTFYHSLPVRSGRPAVTS